MNINISNIILLGGMLYGKSLHLELACTPLVASRAGHGLILILPGAQVRLRGMEIVLV